MFSFWCGNALLEGDFKNTKTYQDIWGQQVIRPLLFYLEKFIKLRINLPHKVYGQFSVW